MAVRILTEPSGQVYPGDRLIVQATGFSTSSNCGIIVEVDGEEIECRVGPSWGSGVDTIVAEYVIPSTARYSVVITAKQGTATVADTVLEVIATTTYTVSIWSYLDGSKYQLNEFEMEEGERFYTGNYTIVPSNSRFQSLVYDYTYTSHQTFTVYSDMRIFVYYKSRPSTWYWTNTIATGYQIKISATEWNNFTAKINEFRAYVGLGTYGFTTVYSGNAISIAYCNQARNAIADLFGYQYSYSSMPSALTTEGVLPASFFTGITNVMNAVY